MSWQNFGGFDSDGSNSRGGSSDDSSDFFSNGDFGGFGTGFDIRRAQSLRSIHGILLAIAFAVVFPIGAILMRVIPAPFAIWIHALAQMLGLALFIAGAAIGIYLGRLVSFGGNDLFSMSQISYHLIIGLVVLALLLVQPILGYIHHLYFKRLRRRQVWSYLHVWNGRITLTLAIINGGLGLMLARERHDLIVAYAVVSAILWVLWMLTAAWNSHRRTKVARAASKKKSRTRQGVEGKPVLR